MPPLSLLEALVAVAPGIVIPAVGLLTRLSLLVMMAPALGMQVLPVRVKVSLVLGLTLLLLPVTAAFYPANAPVPSLLIGEGLAGLFLGVMLRVFIFALSIAGTIIAQTLSLSQVFGNALAEEANTTIATLLTLAGAVLFLSGGYHIAALEMLLATFDSLPPGFLGEGAATAAMAEEVLAACVDGMSLAVSLTLPFLVLNFAYYILLGVMNRAMPQLMVTFVGMPAITYAGIALLVITASGILLAWLSALNSFFEGGAL